MGIESKTLAVFAAALLCLGACTDRTQSLTPAQIAAAKAGAAATQGIAVAQKFQITVDNKPMSIDPDNPQYSILVSSSFAGRGFNITAMDKDHDYQFSVTVVMPDDGPLRPGTYVAYKCNILLGCDEPDRPPGENASYTPIPVREIKIEEIKQAYRAPKFGMEPFTLTLAKVDDAIWPGVGAVKRVKGSFGGRLGYIDHYGDGPYQFIGKPVQVEGSFDLYSRTMDAMPGAAKILQSRP